MRPDEVKVIRDFGFDFVHQEEVLSSTVRSRIRRIRAKFAAILNRLYPSTPEGGDR